MLAQGILLRPISQTVGVGLMATRRFEAGELVWREIGLPRGRPRTWREVCAIPEPYRSIYKHYMYQVGHDSFESLPEFDRLPKEKWAEVQPQDPALFMNHSCDPTCWYPHPDCFEFVARRVILPGEWITYDYAMTETVEDQPWDCHCGADSCRGRVNATDWRLPQLRQAYWGHVARHVQDLMESLEVNA
jgi:hypothetical protein